MAAAPGRTLAAAAMALAVLIGRPPMASPASAATGTVEGHVHIETASSRRLASAGAYPSRVVTIAADRNVSELANVIVFVKAKPTRSAPMHAAVRQSDEEFVPHVVAVTAGSLVDFPNDDLVFHNVFSLSRAGTFDLGRYPKGHSKTRVFDHPYFAMPNSDGEFTIPDVPIGDYEVVAWHERVGEVTLTTSVAAGRASTLSFSLPLTDQP